MSVTWEPYGVPARDWLITVLPDAFGSTKSTVAEVMLTIPWAVILYFICILLPQWVAILRLKNLKEQWKASQSIK